MKQWIRRQLSTVRHDWRLLSVVSAVGLVGVIVVAQFLYPSDRLVPFTVVDGVSLGGWQKEAASSELDNAYASKVIPIYFGIAKQPYRSPRPSEIGLTISNQARIQQIRYPWYLRLIPTSILWVHDVSVDPPTYTHTQAALTAYITKQLGHSCDVQPQNASLKSVDDHFVVIASQPGGTCDVTVVTKLLSQVTPRLNETKRVTVPVRVIAPAVSDSEAKRLGDELQAKLGDGVLVQAGKDHVSIPATELLSWFDFSTLDGHLTYTLNRERAAPYLNAHVGPSVAVKPGVTVVNTYDFTETDRVKGADGEILDVTGTLSGIEAYLRGESEEVQAVTTAVPPTLSYERSYSGTDTGFAALMQQYAVSHPGTYGVSMIELSGRHRRAGYHDTSSFTTASTYKLFVAYSTLKRVEAGIWHWSDQISDGRDLTTCFNDMIEKSDNACAVALLHRAGYKAVTNDAHELGCNDTSFMGNDGIKSTPADEVLFLAQLQTGQMLSQQSSRDRFLNALKQNIYRQGIPAGIRSATVADKVGFLWDLLHDAAIVYSPTGTYVLVIMTDGASWGNIAELAHQIETVRNQ